MTKHQIQIKFNKLARMQTDAMRLIAEIAVEIGKLSGEPTKATKASRTPKAEKAPKAARVAKPKAEKLASGAHAKHVTENGKRLRRTQEEIDLGLEGDAVLEYRRKMAGVAKATVGLAGKAARAAKPKAARAKKGGSRDVPAMPVGLFSGSVGGPNLEPVAPGVAGFGG